MYLPFQNTHEPLQAPQKYINLYKDTIKNKARRTFSGKFLYHLYICALDQEIGVHTKRCVTCSSERAIPATCIVQYPLFEAYVCNRGVHYLVKVQF